MSVQTTSRPAPAARAAGKRPPGGREWTEIATGAVILVVAAAFLIFAISQSGRSLGGGGIELTARFDRIDGLSPGADVRIGGVKVGSVTEQHIDPKSYLAVLRLNVQSGISVPEDSSAEITSESLLGGKYVALVPGGSETMLKDGGEITITQSSVSLESLLGRFIFSVTQLNSQREDGQEGQDGNQGGTAPRNPSAAPVPSPARP